MFKKHEPYRKSDVTREKLYQTAIGMFAKRGFDQTTMRAIAAEAEVAPGAAYYYFESKESIVYEYYRQSHDEHQAIMTPILAKEKKFSERLRRTVASKIELALPYKDMARALYRTAADPKSPLSPFSEESKPLRLKVLGMFREVVEGSRDGFHPEVRRILPEYLWLYAMGVILFWIYDDSADSGRTFELIDRTVPLIDWTNQAIQSPMAAPFRKKILATLLKFTPDLGQEVGK